MRGPTAVASAFSLRTRPTLCSATPASKCVCAHDRHISRQDEQGQPQGSHVENGEGSEGYDHQELVGRGVQKSSKPRCQPEALGKKTICGITQARECEYTQRRAICAPY